MMKGTTGKDIEKIGRIHCIKNPNCQIAMCGLALLTESEYLSFKFYELYYFTGEYKSTCIFEEK